MFWAAKVLREGRETNELQDNITSSKRPVDASRSLSVKDLLTVGVRDFM